MDWVIVGLIASLITAAIIAVGLRAQRKDPNRKWPIIAVGLLAGLVAGLAIIQAIWLGDRYPHRRKAIDRITVLIGGGLVMVATYYAYSPLFGLGPEIESGYIARPGQGYAITLSDDWRVEDISGLEDFDGEVIEPGVEPDLIAGHQDSGHTVMILTIDDGEAVEPRIVAFGTAAAMQTEELMADVSWEAVESSIGDVYRVDAAILGDDGERFPEPLPLSIYLVTRDEVVYQALYFYGRPAPADRWFDIVETFEYLSAAPASSTPGPEGVPELGNWVFDVEFPDGWDVDELQPGEWTRVWAPLRGQQDQVVTLVTALDRETDGRCIAYDVSTIAAGLDSPASTESVTDHFLDAYAGGEGFERHSSTLTALPAGSAGRVRAMDSRGWFYESWLIGAGDTWLALECRAPERIPRGWRAVAEMIQIGDAE